MKNKLKKITGEKLSKYLILNFQQETILPIIKERFNKKGKDIRHIPESEYPILKNFLNDVINEPEEIEKPKARDPYDLLESIGYRLYRCPQYSDFDQFKKYYRENELLCKFNDPQRASKYHIFWIVKDNAEEIKPAEKPSRQDEYGTSCCSISISKDGNNVTQICNRYNHNVPGCDNTFNSNLDNIIEGLTDAFNNKFKFNIKKRKSSCEFTNFVEIDGVYAHYHTEINGIKIGNNTIISDKIINYPPDTHYTYDYFIIDLRKPEIIWDTSLLGSKDGFVDVFNNSVKKVVFVKDIHAVDDNDSDEICYIQK